ncbi:type II toxin-antitoxin system VapC family toxin [Microbacterium sp. 179-I 3D2 NHS]|uniref:type II toxin-antitoxin system VapC family toxin n=1 Tax=Microbacterium sp. 179-I 3D2 NHS TaxID=3235178 RepID=UPI0039A2B91B
MSRWYIETSAALKLIVNEAESDALAAVISDEQPDLVACYLLETELRRSAHSHDLAQTDVSDLLDGVGLYEVPPGLFREAGLLPGRGLRSLDALHIAAAVAIGVDGILTYDLRMAEAALAMGVRPHAPGQHDGGRP